MNNISKIADEIIKESRLEMTLVDLHLNSKNVKVNLNNIGVKERIENELKKIDGFNGISSFIPILNIQVEINVDLEKTDVDTFQRDVKNKFKNFRTPSLRIQ
jgi:hypothetical protein